MGQAHFETLQGNSPTMPNQPHVGMQAYMPAVQHTSCNISDVDGLYLQLDLHTSGQQQCHSNK